MPQYAVISVGEGNSYGHPDDTVLNRLHDLGTMIYQIDKTNTLSCYSDGTVLTISSGK